MVNFNDMPLLSLEKQSEPQEPGKMQFILFFESSAICPSFIPYKRNVGNKMMFRAQESAA